jgi:hypothetical protein
LREQATVSLKNGKDANMKVHWFSVLSVVGVLLMAGNSFGGGLQWKKPVDTETDVVSITHIPIIISTDDAVEPLEILQVQHVEPIKQLPRMAPTVPQSDEQEVPWTERQLEPCTDQLGRLKSIKEISHDIRPVTASGVLPEECALDGDAFNGRHFSQTCFMWKASAVSTKAAYFEDTQLERYGHTKVCPAFQPVLSGAKFFATIPILPYKMGVIPPKECVYTLGHHRAGNCAPYMAEPFPISPRGALFQAGAVAGAVVAIP